MKKKILFMAILTMLVGMFSSCGGSLQNSYPILYVVNSSDYSASVYCDNLCVTSVGARNNSGKVVLDDVSVNLPVHVEVYFSNGKKVTFDNYYFRWNTSYKLTLTNTNGRIQAL